MNDLPWLVFSDVEGESPRYLGKVMAPMKAKAERKARALYGEDVFVRSEASHAAGANRGDQLLERFREVDRRWINHKFRDEDEWTW